MNNTSFIILKIVVSVCSILVTMYVIPYLCTLRNDKRYEMIIKIIEIAVRAAEQTIVGQGQGSVKKEQVMDYVWSWLYSHKLNLYITREQVDQLVEACVYQMKQEAK